MLIQVVIEWLGFDKFQNIIYGFQKWTGETNLLDTDIVMLSVFSGKKKKIKRLEFDDFIPNIVEYCSISCSGDKIIIIHVCKYTDNKILYQFSIETGELIKYKLFISNECYHGFSWILQHSSKFEWVFAGTNGEFLRVCRIVFDNANKVCQSEIFAEFLRSIDIQTWRTRPVIGLFGNEILIFSKNFDFIDVFDCSTYTMSTKELDKFPAELNPNNHYVICASKDGRAIFAVPRRFSNSDCKIYPNQVLLK